MIQVAERASLLKTEPARRGAMGMETQTPTMEPCSGPGIIPWIVFDKRILEPGDAPKPHLLSAMQMGKLRHRVSGVESELQSPELLQPGALSSRDDQLRFSSNVAGQQGTQGTCLQA